MKQEQLMTVEDIAFRIKKAKRTVYHYVETEEIPPSLIIRLGGGSIRMKVADFEEWLEGNKGRIDNEKCGPLHQSEHQQSNSLTAA